ncbi:MAG: 3-hydroxyacyl-CoA dehydrogenase family protein [Solirubrobacterales bacterium]
MEEAESIESPYPRVAVIGSGTIATGVAAVASMVAERVVLLARSAESAERAARDIAGATERLGSPPAVEVEVSLDREAIAGSGLVIEAVAEDGDLKAEVLGRAAETAPEADLATTTSSLSVRGIAARLNPSRPLVGIHVFNPVTGMELVELCVPEGTPGDVASRARRWCLAIGKTPIQVPDTPGFVVNRLLFPYLFEAVRLMERTGLEPEDVDTCMRLGLGYPMGPLALLDLVGLDVATAIGEALAAETGNPEHAPPGAVTERVGRGDLGRKSGRGFFVYDA